MFGLQELYMKCTNESSKKGPHRQQKPQSWAYVTASQGINFFHHLSFVCLKLFILCNKPSKNGKQNARPTARNRIYRVIFYLYQFWNQQKGVEACSYWPEVCWRCPEVYFDWQQKAVRIQRDHVTTKYWRKLLKLLRIHIEWIAIRFCIVPWKHEMLLSGCSY